MYNPQIHHRRSIRLKGYDYSQAGLYFITICVHNRECLFGNIAVGADLRVCPNGQMERVCPNDDIDIGQTHRFAPTNEIQSKNGESTMNMGVRADLCVCPKSASTKGEHAGSPLHCVIQWFKTMSTNEYIRGVKNLNWQPFDGKLWQRNYWEHIIRNNNSYQKIAEYIIHNPENWDEDQLNMT